MVVKMLRKAKLLIATTAMERMNYHRYVDELRLFLSNHVSTTADYLGYLSIYLHSHGEYTVVDSE